VEARRKVTRNALWSSSDPNKPSVPLPGRVVCANPSQSKPIIEEDIKGNMCRNIKTLHNFKPPATEEEIRASSLQFVRKLSGFSKPSKANEIAFNRAIEEVAQAAHLLLASLVTNAPPRDREVEAVKARERSANRFGANEVRPTP
jgi:hypothetical protein